MVSDFESDRAPWRKMLRASDHRLRSALCTFREEQGYCVFRSDKFPEFYAGNGLMIKRPHPDKTLDDWITLFHDSFPRDQYRHVTLTLHADTASPRLLDEAERRGYHVIHEVLMAAASRALAHLADRPEPRASTRVLTGSDDMRSLYELHLSRARGEDWFGEESDFSGLFGKTMAVSEAVDITWLAAKLTNSCNPLDSALGFFDHGKLCRLQEVITAPGSRGQGLATMLIREAGRRAVLRRAETVGLIAEVDGDGHRLYQGLGFREFDREVTLLDY